MTSNDLASALKAQFPTLTLLGLTVEGGRIILELPQDASFNPTEIESFLKSYTGSNQILITTQKPKIDSPERTLPGVSKIIAIASGKGGVGKSTTALNLAISLHKKGQKVGLLDADIYGPSLALMMGLDEKPDSDGKLMEPLSKFGIKVMSMGLLVPPEKAMIWRGPMVQSALTQLLFSVNWGPLDVLIVDLPPGTGDIHLTLTQRVQVTGGIIVTTPQDVALIDARKAIQMFETVSVPILGILENMSGFTCPHCHETTDIFGSNGAKEEALTRKVPFLGHFPLDLETRLASDKGIPITILSPEHSQSQMYLQLAERLIQSI